MVNWWSLNISAAIEAMQFTIGCAELLSSCPEAYTGMFFFLCMFINISGFVSLLQVHVLFCSTGSRKFNGRTQTPPGPEVSSGYSHSTAGGLNAKW